MYYCLCEPDVYDSVRTSVIVSGSESYKVDGTKRTVTNLCGHTKVESLNREQEGDGVEKSLKKNWWNRFCYKVGTK